MQNRKTIFSVGLIFFLIPVLGFPGGFESFLQVAGGLLIMFFASRKTLEKRIVKGRKVYRRREKNPIFIENNLDDSSQEVGAPISTTMNETSQDEVKE